MHNKQVRQRFESEILVHLEQAYNLALWLLHNKADAEDIVQQSCIRAYKGFARFRHDNPVGWFMTIVRNTSYNHLKQQKQRKNLVSFDEAIHADEGVHVDICQVSLDPAQINEMSDQQGFVRNAINKLTLEYREAIYLREIAGYSYKEIATIIELPIGTVMSRLSRARCQLRKILLNEQRKEQPNAL